MTTSKKLSGQTPAVPSIASIAYSACIGLSLAVLPAHAISPVMDNIWNYQHDSGGELGPKPGGLRYGWNKDMRAQAVDRNSPLSPDERYDRHIAMQTGGEAVWEMEVEPGWYQVTVVAGDAAQTDADYKIDVEGKRVVDGKPSAAFPWVSGTERVKVTDGKLTVSSGQGARNNKLAYIHVSSSMAGYYEEPTRVALPLMVNLGGSAYGLYRPDKLWIENSDYGHVFENITQARTETNGTADYQGTDEDELFRTNLSTSDGKVPIGYRVRIAPNTDCYVTLRFGYPEGSDSKKIVQAEVNGTVVIQQLTLSQDPGAGKTKNVTVKTRSDAQGFINITVRNPVTFYPQAPVMAALVVSETTQYPVANQPPPTVSRLGITQSGDILVVRGAFVGDELCLYDLSGHLVLKRDLVAGTSEVALRPEFPGTLVAVTRRHGVSLARQMIVRF